MVCPRSRTFGCSPLHWPSIFSSLLISRHASKPVRPAVARTLPTCLLALAAALGWAVEASTQDLASDKAALEALYTATDGDNWKNNTYWLSSRPVGDWHGVTVENGRVTKLSLHDNQLAGTIPSQLGSLTNLRELWFSDNQLTGSIPAQLGNLGNLAALDLADNQLTGFIPTQLGSLGNLEGLLLYGNQLTGTIPTELGNLASLGYLNLHSNQLTGSIPTPLGGLANLRELLLSGNQLTGSIPNRLGNLANLRKLNLLSNRLTGSIPSELGNLANLQELLLSGNQLTGSIPNRLGGLANLRVLGISENELTGTLPQSFTNLGVLTHFYFHGNAGLCAQADPAIRTWLDGVNTVRGPDCPPPSIRRNGQALSHPAAYRRRRRVAIHAAGYQHCAVGERVHPAIAWSECRPVPRRQHRSGVGFNRDIRSAGRWRLPRVADAEPIGVGVRLRDSGLHRARGCPSRLRLDRRLR